MAIFVSYARRDQPKVQYLTARIRQLGRETWVDESLKGGQSWWDQILQQIRHCDALLVAVSPTSLHSQACTFERQYAEALGKPVLPVLVEHIRVLPPELAVLQVVDYVQPGEAAAIMLAGAVAALPAARALPNPLPPPPPVPLSYLSGLRHQVNAATLNLEQQLDLVVRLETRLQAADSEERDGARELLTLLAQRPDLYADPQQRIHRALQPQPTPDHQPPYHNPAARTPAPPAAPATRSGCVTALAWAGAIFVVLIVLFVIGVLSSSDSQGGCFYDPYGYLVCP